MTDNNNTNTTTPGVDNTTAAGAAAATNNNNNRSPYGGDNNPYQFDYGNYSDDDLDNNQQPLSNVNLLSSLRPSDVDNFSNDVAATLLDADRTLNSGANTSGLGLHNYLSTTTTTPRNNGGKDVTLNAPDTEGGVIENASEMDVDGASPEPPPQNLFQGAEEELIDKNNVLRMDLKSANQLITALTGGEALTREAADEILQRLATSHEIITKLENDKELLKLGLKDDLITRINDLGDEKIKGLLKVNKELNEKLGKARGKLAVLESRMGSVAQVTNMLQKVNIQAMEVERQHTKAAGVKVDTLQEEKVILQHTVNNLVSQLRSGQANYASLETQLQTETESLRILSIELGNMYTERDDLSGKLDAENFVVEEMLQQSEEDKAEVMQLRQQIQDIENRAATLRQQLNTSTGHNSTLQQELEATTQELEATTIQITSLQQHLNTAEHEATTNRQKLEAATARATALQQQFDTAYSYCSSLQTECTTKDDKISSLENDKEKLEGQLQDQLRMISNLENESRARSSAPPSVGGSAAAAPAPPSVRGSTAAAPAPAVVHSLARETPTIASVVRAIARVPDSTDTSSTSNPAWVRIEALRARVQGGQDSLQATGHATGAPNMVHTNRGRNTARGTTGYHMPDSENNNVDTATFEHFVVSARADNRVAVTGSSMTRLVSIRNVPIKIVNMESPIWGGVQQTKEIVTLLRWPKGY